MNLCKIFDNSIHPNRQHQFLRSELNLRCFFQLNAMITSDMLQGHR